MFAIALLFAATTTAGRVALLVDAPDPAAEVAAALASPDPLARAAAARVAAVRNLTALVPKLLDAAAREADTNAQRDEVRAVVMLGTPDEIDGVSKIPMLNVIARAAARRADAYDIYVNKLRPLGFLAD